MPSKRQSERGGFTLSWYGVLDRQGIHSSSTGNGTLMHIADMTDDDNGSSAQSGWRWSGLPVSQGTKSD